jgi:putative Mg2+ transporter-C (MgtC) family protein
MRYPFDQGDQQTWTQVGQLLVATALSSIIGIEREWKHKSAGLRTNTLVGIGAALFMLISKLGSFDVLNPGSVVLDPSRIAAQIVSGIGFIGGGIIFKQRNEIRGLTTAAGVWLSAAVGAACGAGLLKLASVATGLYFVAVLVYPNVLRFLRQYLDRSDTKEISAVIRYRTGADGLQTLLLNVMEAGFGVRVITRLEEVFVNQAAGKAHAAADRQPPISSFSRTPKTPAAHIERLERIFDIHLTVYGPRGPDSLMHALSQLDTVISVSIEDDEGEFVQRV